MSLKSKEELEDTIAQKSGKPVEEIRRLINEKLALYPITPRAAASMVAGDLGIPQELRFVKGKLPSLRGKESIKVTIEEVLNDPHKYDKLNMKFEGYIVSPRVFDYGENKEKEAISFGLIDPTGYIRGVGWKSGPVSLFQGIKNGDTISIDGAGVQFLDENNSDVPQINVWPSCVVEKFDKPKGWKTLDELKDIYLAKTLEQIYDNDEGIITVSVLSVVGTRPYWGCPVCYVGIKEGELCKEHNLERVELFWITLFVGDKSQESALSIPPGIADKLPEMGYYDAEELVGKTMKCFVWYSEERGLMLREILSIEGESGSKKPVGFICPQCSKPFPTQESLNAHILIAHPEKEEKKESIEVKTLKEIEEKETVPAGTPEPRREEKSDLTDQNIEGEALVPTIEVSEKDYKLAKDLVSFLTPADLATVKAELESTVKGDAMALLKKMKNNGFIEIKGGKVRRV
ncbi:MAG: hypothetical protein ACTSPB_02315 [Candidatus Thorarchaeota archaeon]